MIVSSLTGSGFFGSGAGSSSGSSLLTSQSGTSPFFFGSGLYWFSLIKSKRGLSGSSSTTGSAATGSGSGFGSSTFGSTGFGSAFLTGFGAGAGAGLSLEAILRRVSSKSERMSETFLKLFCASMRAEIMELQSAGERFFAKVSAFSLSSFSIRVTSLVFS